MPTDSSPTPASTDSPIRHFQGEHRFLSNFWFVRGGVFLNTHATGSLAGPTVEHVYQAAKTLIGFQRTAILDAVTALDAKKLGSAVDLRPDWELVKIGVMAQLQATKYAEPGLAADLRATGNAELIEGNHWHDSFWGVCDCPVHVTEENPRGTGQNWLGRILMIQRSRLLI
jgi:hypothetical protein